VKNDPSIYQVLSRKKGSLIYQMAGNETHVCGTSRMIICVEYPHLPGIILLGMYERSNCITTPGHLPDDAVDARKKACHLYLQMGPWAPYPLIYGSHILLLNMNNQALYTTPIHDPEAEKTCALYFHI
jgi:hypothetical protein